MDRIKQSLYDWCIENHDYEILDRWDYELNKYSPKDVTRCTGKPIYLKCPLDKHKSEKLNIQAYVCQHKNTIFCHACNSFAQWILDNAGNNFLELYWDYDKNIDIDPWKISYSSSKRVWIKNFRYSKFNSTYMGCNDFVKEYKQKKYNKEQFINKSLGKFFPEVFLIWSNKNKKTPYEYTPHCSQDVWWKCPNGKHKDYLRNIHDSNKQDFRCPECVRERNESFLQEKVRLYIENLYPKYKLLHEYNCTLVPKNPKYKGSQGMMPFDNEVIIDNKHLIIEVHGEQHYINNNNWKQKDLTPEQQLHKQKLHDRYKKYVAFCNGYFYLAIPYWTEKDETYKKLIDNKINEILHKK